MVGMPVCDENSIESRLPIGKRVVERSQMPRFAHARVNQRGVPVGRDEKVGIVAGARHRAGVVRFEQDRLEHEPAWRI